MMNAKKQISPFHNRLNKWYHAHGRKDLPWRHTEDPYAILVSEVMLQQTQVQTVLDRYYQPFLEKFPTLLALATADLDEVMRLWQGLGYYRRAKHLHEAAQLVQPALPDTVDELVALPGIGRNTAHAVLAFAHHQPYPVMEANVKRVLSRIFALVQPNDKQLWGYAFELLDLQKPYDYNQAMMDLGAMICTPKAPQCGACPANGICQGRSEPTLYPSPKKKKVIPVRRQQVLLIEDTHGLIYSSPRVGEFLHGLHQFVELGEEDTAIELNGMLYPKSAWKYIGNVEQVYSHFKQQAEVYHLIFDGEHQANHWYANAQLANCPQSKKEQKVLALFAKKYPA